MEEFGFERAWLPYLYLYGAGGLLFAVAVGLVLRSGSLDLRLARHRRWLALLVAGLLWYALLHLAGILAAPVGPRAG